VFTARYGLSPYIKQTCLIFKKLTFIETSTEIAIYIVQIKTTINHIIREQAGKNLHFSTLLRGTVTGSPAPCYCLESGKSYGVSAYVLCVFNV
jgi:hypothetical protein